MSFQPLPLDPDIAPEIAGNACLPLATCEQILGEQTMLLWSSLSAKRDKQSGETHRTYRGIRRTVNITKRQIKAGMDRLHQVGLVKPADKRVWVTKEFKGKPVTYLALPRTVYGARAQDDHEKLLLMPLETREAILSWPKRGGARPGPHPGRPRKRPPHEPDLLALTTSIMCDEFGDEVRVQTEEEAALIAAEHGTTTAEIQKKARKAREDAWLEYYNKTKAKRAKKARNGKKEGSEVQPEKFKRAPTPVIQPRPSPPEQTGPQIRSTSSISCCLSSGPSANHTDSKASRARGAPEVASSPASGQAAAVRLAGTEGDARPTTGQDERPVQTSSGQDERPAQTSSPVSLSPPALLEPVVIVDRGDLGLAVGNLAGTIYRPLDENVLGQPRRPDYNVIPSLVEPAPPLLPDHVKGTEAARWLLNAYRGAHERKYGKKCNILLKRGQLAESKYVKILERAAELFREHEVAPAAWTMWSFDVWEGLQGDGGKPPLAWVFGEKRIEERLDWFLDEADGYNFNRVYHTEAGKELVWRYELMRLQLVRARARTEEDVREVVSVIFPDDLYMQLVREARNRHYEDQQILADVVKRGEFIWVDRRAKVKGKRDVGYKRIS